MTFIEFSTHGLCSSHAQSVVASIMDPEILGLVLNRRVLEKLDTKCVSR